MSELGQLLDKDALDTDAGPRARAKVTIPPAWANGSVLLEVTLPRLLECARCDGGGCDGCDRSGALRGPKNDASRIIRVRLPKGLGDGVAMRLADPFGEGSAIGQLWLEVRPGETPSRSVRKLGRAPRERRRILPRMVLAMSLLVVLLAGALALITWLRR